MPPAIKLYFADLELECSAHPDAPQGLHDRPGHLRPDIYNRKETAEAMGLVVWWPFLRCDPRDCVGGQVHRRVQIKHPLKCKPCLKVWMEKLKEPLEEFKMKLFADDLEFNVIPIPNLNPVWLALLRLEWKTATITFWANYNATIKEIGKAWIRSMEVLESEATFAFPKDNEAVLRAACQRPFHTYVLHEMEARRIARNAEEIHDYMTRMVEVLNVIPNERFRSILKGHGSTLGR
ncbi:hypothetical protein V8F06_013053 [Rhypophila decipiens]